MAMIPCPRCGQEVSIKAKICPSCRERLGNHKKIVFALVLLLAIVGATVVSVLGIKQYGVVKEQRRQEQITAALNQIDQMYRECRLEEIPSLYDTLDSLNYDTTNMRAIYEYDVSVYSCVREFYDAFKNVDDKLYGSRSSSLSQLIDTLRKPIKNFDALKVNPDSAYGKYINDIQNHIMYISFKQQFIDSDMYNDGLDNWLTSTGYEIIIDTYTSEIAKVPFPYSEEDA